MERRGQPRLEPPKRLAVYDHRTNDFIGELANLSNAGAMVATDHAIRRSTVMRCCIRLPHRMFGYDEAIFDAECVWSRKNVSADYWESGFKLTATGIDEQLISCLILMFKLHGSDTKDMPDVQVVELENRRETPRYDVKRPLPVYEHTSYRQMGQVLDLSVQGMRVMGPEPIARDSIVHYRVGLHKPVFQQDYLTFKARCMWCREKEDQECFESGHRFEEISQQDISIVLYLLFHFSSDQVTKKRMRVI